jgi:hypothetical protein
MATEPTTRADRAERSLKRLGFRLSRAGRTFTVTDNAGVVVINSAPAMTLEDLERWIGEHIKPGNA